MNIDYVTLSSIEGLYDVLNGMKSGFNNGMKIYDTPGSFNFTVPDGITKVKAIVIGGGGGGAAARLPLGADTSAWKTYLATKFFNGEDGIASSFSSISAVGGPGGKQNGTNVGVNAGNGSRLCNGGSNTQVCDSLEFLNSHVEPNGVFLKTKLGVCDVIPNATAGSSFSMTFINAAALNNTYRDDVGPLDMSLPLINGNLVSGVKGDGYGGGGAGTTALMLNGCYIDHAARQSASSGGSSYNITYGTGTATLPELSFSSSVPNVGGMSWPTVETSTDAQSYYATLGYTKKPTIRIMGSGGGAGEIKTGILTVTPGSTIGGVVGRGGKAGKYLKFNPLLKFNATTNYYHTKFVEILGQTAGINGVGIETMLTTWKSSSSNGTNFATETDWWSGTKMYEVSVNNTDLNASSSTSSIAFNKVMSLSESIGRDGAVIIIW